MEKEKPETLFYGAKHHFEWIMAVLIGIGVCLTRLATGPSNIVLGMATLIGVYLWWKNGKKFELSDDAKKYIKICLIFFAATLVSVVDVDNKMYVFRNFLDTWIWRFGVFFLLVAFVQKKKYLYRILSCFFLIFTLDCFTACYQFFILHWHRGRGFHGDYLDLTAIICMVLAMSAIILLDKHFEKKIKYFACIGFVGAIAGLFGCFGRGAFLVSALVAPFYLFFYMRSSKKLAAVIMVVVCLLGGVLISSPKYTQRLSTTLNTTNHVSNVDRIWAWRSSIDMYLDHPVNGVGLNNWSWYYRNAGYKYAEESQNLPHAHSNYMHLIAETGTIGLIGMAFFYIYSLVVPFRRWLREKNPCDLIFFTSFLACMVLFGAFQPTYRLSAVIRTMWFILALVLQLRAAKDS